MFCTTIIPTIGRPTLTRAVTSVLDQVAGDADYEIVVVNDGGKPLADMAWMESPQITLLNTQRRERSFARNTGAAVARGEYLHFLDDDDWMLPGAMTALRAVAAQSQVAWVYGGYRLVDTAGNLKEECRPDEQGNCLVRFMAGEWLPLQSSLVRSTDFWQVGAFAPLGLLLGGDEDVDLTRQIALHGEIAGTQALVADIRVGAEASSTNWTNLHEQSLQSRERALEAPGAFRRLMASARTRPGNRVYWRGRVTYIYLAAALWNLRRRRGFAVASRGASALGSALGAGLDLLRGDYWRGALKAHQADGWLRVERAP